MDARIGLTDDSFTGEELSALDEVSAEIGGLRKAVEIQNSQVAALFRKFDDTSREVIEHSGVLKHLGEAFAKHAADDSAAHKRIDAVEQDIAAAKNQGKGMSFVVGAVGGIGGLAGIIAALKAYFAAAPAP